MAMGRAPQSRHGNWAIGMIGKTRVLRWLLGALLLAAVDAASIVAIEAALTSPAQAQFFRDDRFPFLGRQRPQRGGGFFGGFWGGSDRSNENPDQQAPVDNSRAPPPRKPDPKAEPVTATTSIVVLGDAMADWLAYGLEDAFSDSPEVAIVRKNKIHSGLLRYEPKGDLDWWHVARDTLTQEKANYVVMMLGVSDRQGIRERDLEADKKKGKDQSDKATAAKDSQNKDAQNKDSVEDQEQSTIAAPETQSGKRASGTIEFRSDQWAEIYSKRIDDTIASLKSRGVPVFWVGLPSIRGTKSTADAVYLNDLYRARAERAGAVYIDVWDGFVDETGKYSNFGPDYEGQMRRLRSSDGVFFTKSGALKLAHYVEREIRRYMNSRATPVALPSGPLTPAVPDGKPAARPVAGPVVPLTVTPGNSDELLGGGSSSSPYGDATASRILVKGEPVTAPPGRADDFALQRGSESSAEPAAAAPAGALASAPPAEPVRREPASAPEQKKAATKSGAPGKTTQNSAPKPKATQPQRDEDVPRPPRGLFRSGNSPFGFFR